MKSLLKQAGATMVEYAIMLALIAVVSLAAIDVIGDKASGTFSKVKQSID